jgi:hypothetical protein
MPSESASSSMVSMPGVVTDSFSNPQLVGQGAYGGVGVEQDVLAGRISDAAQRRCDRRGRPG